MTSTQELVAKDQPGGLAIVSELQNVRRKPVKKALEEDRFTDALTQIIRRDFFPDVPKMEAQLEYIEATESNDQQKLREISERFGTTLKTPVQATPSTFETPLATREASGDVQAEAEHAEPQPKQQKIENTTLDKFLSQYQSEDDASFEELMEQSKARHQKKYAWLYEQQEAARQALEGPQENKLAIMGENNLAITDGSEGQLSLQHGAIKMWTYTPKNSFMYVPEGAPPTAQEEADRKNNARSIDHKNTRLPHVFKRKLQAALSGTGEGSRPELSKEKIGVDGKALGDGESPAVNGYGFVTTPQIHPGVDASPLMTWGEVEGTPFRIDAGDFTPGTGPTFKLPKTTRREEIALQLAEKVNTANRERKKAAQRLASSPSLRQRLGTPGSIERLRLLSPAARKLVSRASTPGSFRLADTALRASYTPKPEAHNATPLAASRAATPSLGTARASTPSSSSVSLTDNLLNLKSSSSHTSL